MTNKQIAQKFAAGATTGKGSNLFIEGDTVYSYGYHFAVARRTGEKTVNLTTRKYSQSTTRHTSLVHAALRVAGFVIRETSEVNR